MSLVPYTYKGPCPSGVTFADGPEVPLHPGKDVDLDPAHPYVQTLEAMGYLVRRPIEPPATPETPESTTRTKPARAAEEKGAKP